MITRRYFLVPPSHGKPGVVGNEFVTAPCGCRCVLGVRIDNHESATVATPCDPEAHGTFIREFQLRLKSLAGTRDPNDTTPFIEHIEKTLMDLYEERVVNAPAD